MHSFPAFREVFNLFDVNGGGTIDADELDAALKAVDVHLSSFEIHDVLQVIDEDGALLVFALWRHLTPYSIHFIFVL